MQLLLLIIKDDQMVALWNQLYQQHADSIMMGVVDCRQAEDLCAELAIEQTPQLLFVDKEAKALIYYDRQWNSDSITEWLVGDHEHSEEDFEIYIQVDQPKVNEDVQWVTDVEVDEHKDNTNNHLELQDHIHEDHHSENIEKIKYEELQQLILLNEQLSYRAEKFRRDIDLVKHQATMLNTSYMIELNRQETSINFTIYLYSSGMLAFVCVLIAWKKINVLKKKSSILVQ